MGAIPLSDNFAFQAEPVNHGLCVGLTMAEVRALLAGWKDHPIRAAVVPGESGYFSLWDFVPPEALGASPIRLTFEDDRLVLWGTPAAHR